MARQAVDSPGAAVRRPRRRRRDDAGDRRWGGDTCSTVPFPVASFETEHAGFSGACVPQLSTAQRHAVRRRRIASPGPCVAAPTTAVGNASPGATDLTRRRREGVPALLALARSPPRSWSPAPRQSVTLQGADPNGGAVGARSRRPAGVPRAPVGVPARRGRPRRVGDLRARRPGQFRRDGDRGRRTTRTRVSEAPGSQRRDSPSRFRTRRPAAPASTRACPGAYPCGISPSRRCQRVRCGGSARGVPCARTRRLRRRRVRRVRCRDVADIGHRRGRDASSRRRNHRRADRYLARQLDVCGP